MTAPISERISFIGAGQMAEALVAGLLSAGVTERAALIASDPSEERRGVLARRFGVETVSDNREAASRAQVVVLAVKPQALEMAGRDLGVLDGKLIVSLAAGVSIRKVMECCRGTIRVVRVMPNAAVVVREGMSALVYGPGVTAADRALVMTMFRSVGQVTAVEEHLLDAVTGVSGSGPAYVFMAIEALADGGVKMGLPRATAEQLAAHTFYGAARSVLETGEHPGRLKDRVASPGGTTIAGLHQLEEHGFRASVIRAVAAATRRAEAMGRSCSS